MTEKKKYRVILPDADAVLRQRCLEAAEKIYGNPLPKSVSTRLEQELSAIEANQYASDYLIAAMIADASKKEGYPTSTRGMLGSVLTAFLCGITVVNPLPAHYWCPKCHHFEMIGEEEDHVRLMGYDLPEKLCPVCGEIMNADGANIRLETLMGIDLNREPRIAINAARQMRPKIAELLKDTFGQDCVFRAGVKKVQPDGSIKKGIHPGGIFIVPKDMDIRSYTLIRDEYDEEFQMPITDRDYLELGDILNQYDLLTFSEFDMLHALEERTGIHPDQISIDNREVMGAILDGGFAFLATKRREVSTFEQSVMQATKAQCFTDLIRVNGLLHGTDTWAGNGEKLVEAGIPLQKLIAFRDDVMQDLLEKGISRQRAFEIMDHVRKGLGVSEEAAQEMIEAGVPDWYITSCRRIKYLFPKAHAIEYSFIYWKLAYYKLYFPEEYRKALEEYGREPEIF